MQAPAEKTARTLIYNSRHLPSLQRWPSRSTARRCDRHWRRTVYRLSRNRLALETIRMSEERSGCPAGCRWQPVVFARAGVPDSPPTTDLSTASILCVNPQLTSTHHPKQSHPPMAAGSGAGLPSLRMGAINTTCTTKAASGSRKKPFNGTGQRMLSGLLLVPGRAKAWPVGSIVPPEPAQGWPVTGLKTG